ncbi:Flp family type IVb pilin [Burkholderia latens]|uniref:Flp family type IVb pilin n=1 Tax=Burkholderia latens TaxID=488446 RepID=A0A6H9STT4_9BURK|nr:Flp family type IVb pilin [Burkholderia latens]KAB0643984.1 Flp family type IVb pilin [Burkholderia latens]VWC18454.1 pilus assembly protein [Burkholderia latens]
MQTILRAACGWLADERGVTSIEYALLASIFACVVLGTVVTLKGSLANAYEAVAIAVTSAVSAALALFP